MAPGARVKACLLGHLCWARVVPLFDFDGSRFDEKKNCKKGSVWKDSCLRVKVLYKEFPQSESNLGAAFLANL